MSIEYEQIILDTIAAEQLKHYAWMNDERSPRVVGIRKTETGWGVYVTDERAAIWTDAQFEDEIPALDKFLRKLRQHNQWIQEVWAEGGNIYE